MPGNLSNRSIVYREQLEALLLAFDKSWTPTLLASEIQQLPNVDQAFHELALIELVKVDMEHWWRSGRDRTVEDYLAQMPELGSIDSVSADLVKAEYDIRRQFGQPVEIAELGLRFPRQLDQLRQLIESSHLSRAETADASIDTSQTGTTETAAGRPDSVTVLPNQFGRYRIVRQLGAGAMGAVYLARDTQLDREVALKTPSFGGNPDPELIQRFYREARSAAMLQHRNICPIYDVGEINGTHFISMAYIAGRPLTDFIRAERSISERAAASVVRKLAMALGHAHDRGVIHRDLKPANIMIDCDSEPVVMDFGLARREADIDQSGMTQTGMILGTPSYMSPEQVEAVHDEVGPASDIYSLGIVLFQLLSARLPFTGSVAAVLGQIMTQQPPKPSEFRPQLDREMEAICLKMMSKSVSDRHESMKEVAEALSDYLKSTKAHTSASTSQQEPTQLGLSTVDRDKLNTGGQMQSTSSPPHVSGSTSQDRTNSTMPVLGEEDSRSDSIATATDPGKTSAIPNANSDRRAKQPFHIRFRRWNFPFAHYWRRQSTTTKWLLATVSLLLFVALPVVLFTLPAGEGMLRIEVNDENLQVFVDGKRIALTGKSWEGSSPSRRHSLSVRIGEQQLELSSPATVTLDGQTSSRRLRVMVDGIHLSSNHFMVTRNATTAMAISLETELIRKIQANRARVTCVDISSDSRIAVSSTWRPNACAQLWDLATGTQIGDRFASKGLATVRRASFSLDGNYLLTSGGNRRADVWKFESTNPSTPVPAFASIRHTRSEGDAVKTVDMAPDGSRVITGRDDRILRIWNVRKSGYQATRTQLTQLTFGPDAANRQVRAWFVNQGKQILAANAVHWNAAFGTFILWNDSLSEIRRWTGRSPIVSRCRRWLLYEDEASEMVLWDLQESRETSRFEKPREVWPLSLSTGGKRILMAAADGSVHLWDATGHETSRYTETHFAKITVGAFSRDGKLALTGDESGELRLWRVPVHFATSTTDY